jgi:3-oxoacyl-[acyl-carrier-protein] synthase-3
MPRYATIIGTGHYLPDWKEVTNDELRARFNEKVPEFVDKMEASSGIKTRWYAPRDWCTSDLATLAAQEALKSAGIKPEDLDLIILGTDTPDYITPSTSVVVQYKLGAKNAGTFDVSCACAGFPTGLNIAAGLIATNPAYKYILVIGVYMMSKLAAQDDPMLFFYGDGAGAAVLTGDSQPGFISSAFLADGSFHQFWGIYSGATYEPATVESVQAGRTNVRFLQRYPPEVNVVGWEKLMRALAKRGQFDFQDINLAIFTQVRLPTIEEVMGLLGLPMTKTHWIMDKWGYTGSACVPMCFDDAVQSGKVHSGDLVTFVGSGVGYNQAAAAFRMP